MAFRPFGLFSILLYYCPVKVDYSVFEIIEI